MTHSPDELKVLYDRKYITDSWIEDHYGSKDNFIDHLIHDIPFADGEYEKGCITGQENGSRDAFYSIQKDITNFIERNCDEDDDVAEKILEYVYNLDSDDYIYT